jgi:hypothetical protein
MGVAKTEVQYLSEMMSFLQNSKGFTYIFGFAQLEKGTADVVHSRPTPEIAVAVV